MGILPMTFHGRDTRATLLQTFLVSHGWVERDTVVVEPRVARGQGVVVAAQDIQLVHCGLQIAKCEIRNRRHLVIVSEQIRHRTYESQH